MDFIYKDLKLIIEGKGGIISAGDLFDAGVNRAKLYELIEKGILTRESHGNYVLADDEPDESFHMVQPCSCMECQIVFRTFLR